MYLFYTFNCAPVYLQQKLELISIYWNIKKMSLFDNVENLRYFLFCSCWCQILPKRWSVGLGSGLVTVNWKSMKASRPWHSLAPGSFDTWLGSLSCKITALPQNLKPAGMISAESSAISVWCSLSCTNCHLHNRKPLPHLNISTLFTCGIDALLN